MKLTYLEAIWLGAKLDCMARDAAQKERAAQDAGAQALADAHREDVDMAAQLAEKVGTERRRALRGLVRRAARGQAQEQRRAEGDV